MSALASSALGPARPRTTTALCVAMQAVGGGLGWSLLPPLMGQMAHDLRISHGMGGLIWGAAPLGIALASPFGGTLVDRHGARWVAGLAMLVGALACAARALVVGPWSLAATMLLFGAHIGFVAPALPKALSGHVPAGRLGRANGLALVGYTLGTALTVLTARLWLAPALGGWRPTMVVAAAAMALTAVLWMTLLRDRGTPSRHASLLGSLSLIKNRQLVRVAAAHFLLFGGYLALLGLLPRALLESGLAPTRVGLAVASWLAVAGLANFVGPMLSDRLGRRRPFFFVGGALAGTALLLVAWLPRGYVMAPLMLAALGGGCLAPLLFSLPLELPGIGPARAGAALGLLMLIGQLGGFLLPLATGQLVGGAGFGAALTLLAIAHLGIMAAGIGLKETGAGTRVALAREAVTDDVRLVA